MSFEQQLFQRHKIKKEDVEELKKEYFIQSNFRLQQEQKILKYFQGSLPSFFKKQKNIIQKNEEKIKELDFNPTSIEKNYIECLNEKFMFNKFQNKRAFTDKQKLSKQLIEKNQEKKYFYYYLGGMSIFATSILMSKRYKKTSLVIFLPQIILFYFIFGYLQNISNINKYFYKIPKLPEDEWEAEKMYIYSQCLHHSKEPLLKLLNNQGQNLDNVCMDELTWW